MSDVFIAGYSDRFSARPGDIVKFFVSSYAKSNFTANLYRSISADPNPAGLGVVEERADEYFKTQIVKSRVQKIISGSFAESDERLEINDSSLLQVSISFFPTLVSDDAQTLFSYGDLAMFVDQNFCVVIKYGDTPILTTSEKLSLRAWHTCEFSISADGNACLSLLRERPNNPKKVLVERIDPALVSVILSNSAFVRIGAAVSGELRCFNGKIEAPTVSVDSEVIARWDFSQNISSLIVEAKKGPNLRLHNVPTRGVTGKNWDGSEFNWKHKPEHYAAIYFHEDDIYDFDWDSDFEFLIPEDMQSGVYIMRIEVEGQRDAIPFFVCPPLGKAKSDVCVLVSTLTYTIYGNHARPDYHESWREKSINIGAYPHNPAAFKHYGLSTYNTHSDGSGICHASHKRVLFNLRPGFVTFGSSECSGLRHFQADSHLISWLHHVNMEYDIITDEELDIDGYEAIAPYSVLMTGSHPEYHTTKMLDALTRYRDEGGSLMYLGGNGFYWRIARHSEDPSLFEIRRSEDGIRAWAAEPGEYYNAFDGTYGGLWRRNGRPPQKLVGIGFTAQGNFVGMPFKRTCFDPDFDWVFNGINEEILGNFGFSGGGAAGFELDRVDEKLGDQEKITILAQSFDTENKFMLVPEELLTHLTNLSGESEDNIKRADMVYFETASGGSVFSVGSITFCGSLPWNGFDNSIAKLLWNVLHQFRSRAM